jgi:hypothetical protein
VRSEDADSSALRRSVILVAAVAIAGLAAELVIERHWGTPITFVPWVALVGFGWCVWGLWRRPSARDLRIARVNAIASSAAAFVGIGLHVNENLQGRSARRALFAHLGADERARAMVGVSLLVIVASQRHPALAR